MTDPADRPSDVNIVERAALSLPERARARLTRALLASLAPRDPDVAAWFGPAAKLVDDGLAEVVGDPASVEAEASDPDLNDPTLVQIRERRREIESGEVSIFEDRFILSELKRRLGLGE